MATNRFNSKFVCVACKVEYDPVITAGTDDDNASAGNPVVCGCGKPMSLADASFVQSPKPQTVGEANYKAFNALVAVAKEFIQKVEDGHARSLTTYMALKNALELMPDQNAVLVPDMTSVSPELQAALNQIDSGVLRSGKTINLNF